MDYGRALEITAGLKISATKEWFATNFIYSKEFKKLSEEFTLEIKDIDSKTVQLFFKSKNPLDAGEVFENGYKSGYEDGVFAGYKFKDDNSFKNLYIQHKMKMKSNDFADLK